MREPLRIGLIGVGKFASEYYLPIFYEHEEIQISALANKSEDKISKVSKEYNIKNLFSGDGGWRKLVSLDEINAVIICTPNHLHAEMAIAAMSAGKHVLVEKPMAVSLDEGKVMIQTAMENGVILMVSFPQRFLSTMQECKRILNSNILGKIHAIESKLGHPGPEYWNPSGEWFFDTSKSSGGVLIDLGIHQIDYLCWLTDKKIREVSAFISTSKPNISVEDNALLIANFEDNILASLYASWNVTPHPENSCTIYCEKGFLEVQNTLPSFLRIHLNASAEQTKLITFQEGKNSKKIAIRKMIEHFMDRVSEQAIYSNTSEDSYHSLEVISAAYQAVRNRAVIAV